jgi:DtxR family Mn-dependent transcriptional regulator
MTASEPLSATGQHYLETIYNVTVEGDPVVGARLAEQFGVSPASVSMMLQRLERDGYLTLDRRQGAALTELGMTTAATSVRRHRLVERFLFDVLHMDWVTAHEQAHALEHAITPTIEAHMVAVLGNPTTCPHGNPIPGSAPQIEAFLSDQHAMRLGSAPVGQQLRVVCVSEVVEDEATLLRYVEAVGLRPDRLVQVTGQDQAHCALQVQGQAQPTLLPHSLAAKIWVVAAQD